VNRPHLLILDEPLHGAGTALPRSWRSCWRLNRELGMTVLLAEQQLSFIRRVADRFCLLYRGRNVAQGHVNELMTSLSRTGCRGKQDAEIEITTGFGISAPSASQGISPRHGAGRTRLSVARYS
jgi:ABC-type multidrug transport system ATPase subunit